MIFLNTSHGMMPAQTVFNRYSRIPELSSGQSSGQQFKFGTVSLAASTQSGTVTGLNLPFYPEGVKAWISRPAGGDNIGAWVLTGTVSTDGFSYELDGETRSDDYVLNWVCFG